MIKWKTLTFLVKEFYQMSFKRSVKKIVHKGHIPHLENCISNRVEVESLK